MRPIDLAYIAGFLDGEGCITLNNRRGTGFTKVVIEINQNKREALDWITETIRLGRVYGKPRKYGRTYTWCCFAKEGRLFIPLILPYLIVKRKQAESMLLYFNAVDTMKFGSKERAIAIDDLIKSYRIMNKVGAE